MNADYKDFKHKELTDEVTTTRIVGGLASPKRALLPAPLKGIPYNFSMTIARRVVSDRL